jgi:hypothetical protein
MNADVLTTRAADGIAVITLGSAKRIYFDVEMGDALTEALDGFAGDSSIRVRLSTAQWRLRGACRRIRRSRLPTLNVSSATLLRHRWRKALRLNEISS